MNNRVWMIVPTHARLPQRTWRNEPNMVLNWAPLGPCLSFDGRTWVSVVEQKEQKEQK